MDDIQKAINESRKAQQQHLRLNLGVNEDIQKAKGEGSRGGNVIGHTKSGNPIYGSMKGKQHKSFTSKDHRDATKHHLAEAKKYKEDSPEYKHHWDQAWKHDRIGNRKEIEEDDKKNLKKAEEVDLEKALNPSRIFNGHDDDMKFSKKGSEIKEKLIYLKSKEESHLAEYKKEMEEYREKAGCEPKQEAYIPYDIQSFVQVLPELPKIYSWKQMRRDIFDSNEAPIIESLVSYGEKANNDSENEAMRKYNENVEKYIEHCSSIKQTETLINNIDDKSTYKLRVEQLAALGF